MHSLLPLSDDLESGLPAELVPAESARPQLNREVYVPPGEDDPDSAALPSDPGGLMRLVETRISELRMAQASAQTLNDKDKMAALGSQVAAAYGLLAKLMALDVMTDLRQNYRRLPNDLKLDLLKIASQHGALVPKESTGPQGGGFQLNIVFNGQATPTVTPVTLENQT